LRTPQLVSARLAKVGGGDSSRSLETESRAVGRAGGNRPATVQQVVAERYEQSGSLGVSAEADRMALAHAPSSISARRL